VNRTVDSTDVRSGARSGVRTGVDPRWPLTKRIRRGWIIEILVGAGIYLSYDWLRDQATGSASVALAHAHQVVDVEKFFGLYQERAIQQAFLSAHWFMSFWNIWYGTIHFVMPLVALVVLYRKLPARYVRWRNTLACMLGISLVAFWLYPLMPPRLMPSSYGFVDGAARYFNFGPQVKVQFGANGQPTAAAVAQFGNLFAAMPSLHVGWSTWTVLALWPAVRRRWVKVLLACYPLTILFCIVVTANHWILDAVGGLVVLALGWCCAMGIEWALARRRERSTDLVEEPVDALEPA
jgi:membrane-associated phospholipid phosphatase